MAKIKNWERMVDSPTFTEYERIDGKTVSICWSTDSTYKYYVKSLLFTNKRFKTKAHALKFAVGWMKKHTGGFPKGVPFFGKARKRSKTEPIRAHIGKSYKDAVISGKKPKNSVKVGETKYYRRYTLGVKEYLVAKPGFKLVGQ